MKKHFSKELVKTKKDFKNSTNCWICDDDYVESNVKVRNHCHITGKYRGSACRNCNINGELNHKVLIAFHNLRNYDSHHVMQELGKLNFKINAMPNGLEKYMSFIIIN